MKKIKTVIKPIDDYNTFDNIINNDSNNNSNESDSSNNNQGDEKEDSSVIYSKQINVK